MSISGDMKPQKFLILICLSSWPHTCIPVSGLASGPRSTEAIVDRTEAWAAETHTAPGTAATPELDIAGVEGGAGDGGARRMGLAKWQWVMWCKEGVQGASAAGAGSDCRAWRGFCAHGRSACPS